MKTNIRIINDKNVHTYYKDEIYYSLEDIIKYLLKEKDNLMAYTNIRKDKNIKLTIRSYYYNDIRTRKYYVSTKELIKIIFKYSNNEPLINYMSQAIIEKINEIDRPELCLDRYKTISNKKGNDVKLLFTKKINSTLSFTNEEILFNEIYDK